MGMGFSQMIERISLDQKERKNKQMVTVAQSQSHPLPMSSSQVLNRKHHQRSFFWWFYYKKHRDTDSLLISSQQFLKTLIFVCFIELCKNISSSHLSHTSSNKLQPREVQTHTVGILFFKNYKTITKSRTSHRTNNN